MAMLPLHFQSGWILALRLGREIGHVDGTRVDQQLAAILADEPSGLSPRIRHLIEDMRAEWRELDARNLLSTTDPSLSAEDVALGYKQLLEVERAFRTLKHELDRRPLYHRLDQPAAARRPRLAGHTSQP